MIQPAIPMTLGAMSARAAEKWPNHPALHFDASDETLTFAQLEHRSNQLAHALIGLGVALGDRVALMTDNRSIFALAWLAIGKIGAAAVPINPGYRTVDATHLLEHAGVSLAITDQANAPSMQLLRKSVLSIKHHVVEDNLSSLLAQYPLTPPECLILPTTLANIQFTSGTTGLPKGCMLSHRFWTQLGQMVADSLVKLSPLDVMLTAQPFSYIDPQWNVVAMLASGAKLVVLDRFRPSRFWDKINKYEVTFFYCLGAMPNLLLSQAGELSEKSHRLRFVMCSGIPASRHAELEQRFGVPWYEVYGTTETGADLMTWPEMGASLRGTGAVGVALPHREARVADESAQPLPSGATGELLLRGTAMMDGYYRNAEATRAAFDLGWYHTGDLARMDDQGVVTIVGRKKDMIRRSGENISAAEVEETIMKHPDVLLAAVVAVPDPLRGEEVKAFVVLKTHVTNEAYDLEEIASFLEPRLARFKIPRYWEQLTSLPFTASQRIAKHVLVARGLGERQLDRLGGSTLSQR